MSNVIGHVKCSSCDFDSDVKEGTSGTLSIICKNPACKAQTFIKSPGGVQSMKARLAAASSSSSRPAPAAAAAGGGKKTKGFLGGLI